MRFLDKCCFFLHSLVRPPYLEAAQQPEKTEDARGEKLRVLTSLARFSNDLDPETSIGPAHYRIVAQLAMGAVAAREESINHLILALDAAGFGEPEGLHPLKADGVFGESALAAAIVFLVEAIKDNPHQELRLKPHPWRTGCP